MSFGRKLSEDEAALVRLRRQVRDRAHRESLRVPWKHFAQAVAEYAEWSRWCIWVRTTMEANRDRLTPQLEQALAERVPGFLDQPHVRRFRGPRKTVRFWLALVKWGNERYFSEAWQQGWDNALGWYAAQDSLEQRAWYYWQQQEDCRKAGDPVQILSYAEWTSAIKECPELIIPDHPKVRHQEILTQANVDSERLALTVDRYVHHAAFAHWVKAIEGATEDAPPFLLHAILSRWPDCNVPPCISEEVEFWSTLLEWVEQRFFTDAVAEGWLPALQYFAHEDLYYQRICWFSLVCEERWSDAPPLHYPPFERWIEDVDSYTETD